MLVCFAFISVFVQRYGSMLRCCWIPHETFSTLVMGSVVLQTAEMPGLYQPGEYDVAGFAVGSVKQDRVINGKHIQEGDVLIALPSSGLHSNGYSLVRKVLEASTLKATFTIGSGDAASKLLHPKACWYYAAGAQSCQVLSHCSMQVLGHLIHVLGQRIMLHLLSDTVHISSCPD